jgi:hypothetical protein
MNRPQHVKTVFPDEQTLLVWENMRIEILHELQEGADADVPDSTIDTIGELVVTLNFWRDQKRVQTRLH